MSTQTARLEAGTDFMRLIQDIELDDRTKGIPLTGATIRLGDVGAQRWNVLKGDMMLPLMTVRPDKIHANLRLMRDYAEYRGVSIAPHGKSTMCPQLFLEQINVGGSWGITAATVQQTAVVAATGVKNIIIANEVVSKANITQLVELKRVYPKTQIYHLVDSLPALDHLVRYGREPLAGAKFQILLEVGYVGGRTGVRTVEEANALLTEIARYTDVVELCGVECYEGIISLPEPDKTIAAVDAFLSYAVEVLALCRSKNALAEGRETLLSAGGSSYFDRAVEAFTKVDDVRVVLRGGSYLTYDHGFYETKMRQLEERGGLEGPKGHINPTLEFKPALEVWSAVQSLLDPGVAVMAMGIRDIPFDLGYPRPLRQYRDGNLLRDLSETGFPFKIVNSNDQHAYLEYPRGADIAIGDVFAHGISHPCTAFDKWDVLYAIDEETNVLFALKTFF